MEWHRSWTHEKATGEYIKIGITLKEEDLQRVLGEMLPTVRPDELTILEAFQLMETEAEEFINAIAMIRFNFPDLQTALSTIEGLRTQRGNVITDIKKRLGLNEEVV